MIHFSENRSLCLLCANLKSMVTLQITQTKRLPVRDVLNSEEFPEETETHRVINSAQRQILLTQFTTCLNTGTQALES